MNKTMGIEYRDNKIAGEIKVMMEMLRENGYDYPFFSYWSELCPNEVNDIIWRIMSHRQPVFEAIKYIAGPALDQRILDILEEEDMTITHYAGDFDIQWCSPAGEDYHMNIDSEYAEAFISSFVSQVENFDVDDHAEIWIESRGRNGVPPTIRGIVEDAEAIEEKLKHVAKRLNSLDLDD